MAGHIDYTRKWQEANPQNVLYTTAKTRAAKRGLEFTIQLSDVVIPERCPILKCLFNFKQGIGRKNDGPSLDRIDPSKGYIPGNIQVISDLANRMKSNATTSQLRTFGEWAINNL